MKLAWGAKVSPLFRVKVAQIAEALQADPSHLMACMAFETGRTFSPSVHNPASSATGLIQFMQATAIGLGTTVELLAAMTAEDQLSYVYDYLKPFTGRLKTLGDCYMAILWPAAVGQPDEYIVFGDRSAAYAVNKGLDFDHDGVVTKGECTAIVQRLYAEGMNASNVWVDETTQPAAPIDDQSTTLPKENTMANALEAAAGIASIFNPMAGGALGIAGKLFEAFSPVLQTKLAKEINRHTDDPSVGQNIAATLAQTVVDQAKVLTGKPDAFDAVAQARQDPDVKAKLEASVESELTALQSAADKTVGYDQAYWDAQNKGKQTVSSIAIEEHKAGLWDMTKTLVKTACAIALIGSLILLAAIVYQSIWAKIDPVLLALAGPLLTITFGAIGIILAYRFDGTKDASLQTKTLMDVASRNRAQ